MRMNEDDGEGETTVMVRIISGEACITELRKAAGEEE